MRKLLLGILFVMPFVTGCGSEDDDNNNNTPVVVNPFVGTYEVEFFGTGVENCDDGNAAGALCAISDVFYVSNNCADADNIYNIPIGVGGKNMCTYVANDPDNSSQTTVNYGRISVLENIDGSLSVTTKIYMSGGPLESLSISDKYQYTTYTPATKQTDGSYTGTGVSGSSLNTTVTPNIPSVSTVYSTSPFTLSMTSDDKLRIDMTLKGKKVLNGALTLDAPTIVSAKKLSNVPEILTNEIPKFLTGTYNVEFFGSGVENCVDVATDTAGGGMCLLADIFYVSNDCTTAQNIYSIPIGVGGKNQCDAATQVTLNEGTISIARNVDGTYAITSKMFMNDGAVEASAADKYQYTVYNPATQQLSGAYTGTGVKGSSLDIATNMPTSPLTDYATSPFSVQMQSNGDIRIDMTLKGKTTLNGALKIDAPAIVSAKKTSDIPQVLTNSVPTLP